MYILLYYLYHIYTVFHHIISIDIPFQACHPAQVLSGSCTRNLDIPPTVSLWHRRQAITMYRSRCDLTNLVDHGGPWWTMVDHGGPHGIASMWCVERYEITINHHILGNKHPLTSYSRVPVPGFWLIAMYSIVFHRQVHHWSEHDMSRWS